MLSKRVYGLFKYTRKFKTLPALFSRLQSSSMVSNLETNVIRSSYPDVQIPNCSLDDFMWDKSVGFSDKTALVCGITGKSYTYNDVFKRSRALARALRWKLKLQRGDTIAAVLPNVPEYPIILLGAMHAGIIVTTVNPIYTVDEIAKQLLDSKAKFVFTVNEGYNIVDAATKKITDTKIPIIAIKTYECQETPTNAVKFEELCDNNLSPVDSFPELDDVCLLPYSSGTTGLPKGVLLTYRNILSNVNQMQSPYIKLNRITTATEQDVVPLILPIFHIYGLVVIFLNMFSEGIKLVTLPRFRPDTFLKLLSTYKPHLLHCAPPLVLFLLNHPDAKLHHIESLRCIMSGAAPLGATDIQRFFEKSKGNTVFLQGYGLTETSPLTHMQSFKTSIIVGSIGESIPNTDCKIVPIDDDSKIGLGPNKSGELLIRGPQIMKGYLNNEIATENAIVDNGWFRTGDIGHYNELGHFFITDRLKELIKVKGFQVAPAELEALLRHHPAISDAAVVGLAHPKFGEVPKAFIVIKKGVMINIDDIHAYVNSEVADYKRLTGGIIVLNAIPKSISGKILRRELKNM